MTGTFHNDCFFPPRFLRRLSLLWLGVLLLARAAASDSVSPIPSTVAWNPATQGGFVVSLCRDKVGNVWAGTEDKGVWRYSPVTRAWTQFTAKDGLGDDNAYALICDRQGRIWAGTLNHGVSVFNGKTWRTYDQTNGPLGAHVTALATSPVDGDVWGGTEAGLFRYSPAHETWTYYTRAHGLPSDQISALAFDAAGSVFAGTECEGLAIGSRVSGYAKWRTVSGPSGLAVTSGGRNLPSDQVNAVLVVKDGAVYVGTDRGLARSLDGGEAWRYTRGADYKAKAEQQYRKATAVNQDVRGDLLAEDYVASLAQDSAGRLWVGHRTQGCEALDINTLRRVDSSSAADFVTALAPGADGSVLAGGYGAGLVSIHPPTDAAARVPAPVPHSAFFPAAAKPPTLARLREMLQAMKSLQASASDLQAMYLGEDWATQGDWTGRYGRQWATLCAARSPFDHNIQEVFPFQIEAHMGPHHAKGDSLRRWVQSVQTDNPKSLYDPIPGYRRQAEWDDHAEAYPRDYEGPDILVTASVPAGLHRVSLYFMNKDGHTGTNRARDYRVLLRPSAATPDATLALPVLAQARVHAFWGGKYVQFVVRGPGKYSLQIAKNNSFNTIVSGVFVERLLGPSDWQDKQPMGWMGGIRYDPPDPDTPTPPDPHLLDKLLAAAQSGIKPPVLTPAKQERTKHKLEVIASARALWSALDACWDKQDGVSFQWPYRLLAYRAIASVDAPDVLQANWRWALRLWTQKDRQQFKEVMEQAHQALLDNNPQMKHESY